MLSYQHAYHAGNFADVVKHITLCLICDYMKQKDKPLFYLETHSGRGKYDLSLAIAHKTAEFKTGVSPLWQNKLALPPVFDSWMSVIEKYNSDALNTYPGSPLFALSRLRQQDRFTFCELHPLEFKFLKQLDKNNKSIQFLFDDGVAQMNAVLPPKEKRGIIFIDPSYEIKEEYQTIPEMIKRCYKKFPTGVYCLWYPILNNQAHASLLKHINAKDFPDQLNIEFLLDPTPKSGMKGCGMLILNPPYVLKGQMDEVSNFLQRLWRGKTDASA